MKLIFVLIADADYHSHYRMLVTKDPWANFTYSFAHDTRLGARQLKC